MAKFEIEFPGRPGPTVTHLLHALPAHGWTVTPTDAVDGVDYVHVRLADSKPNSPPIWVSAAASGPRTQVRIESDDSPRLYRQLRDSLQTVRAALPAIVDHSEFPVIDPEAPVTAAPPPPPAEAPGIPAVLPLQPAASAQTLSSRANIGSRCVARWIDMLVPALLLSVLIFDSSGGGPAMLITGLLHWLWEFAWLATGSATVGKYILGLRVHTADTGEPVSVKGAAVRSADQFVIWGLAPMVFAPGGVSILAVYFAIILLSSTRQSPMDRLAGTIVIPKPGPPSVSRPRD